MEVMREWVGIESPTAPRAVHGAYPHEGVYHTLRGYRPKVAFLVGHHVANFMDHYLGPLLANEEFGVLGWTTRYKNAPAYFQIENALIDVGAGVQWLREVAGVETVILVGNSGGGSFYATYQAQAVNPDTITVGEEFKAAAGASASSAGGQLSTAPGARVSVQDALQHLPPADLFISLNSHPGRPDVLTKWLDPAVTDEGDLFATDPELDMFNPQNGPPYSLEFITKYREAQIERNNRISAWARQELADLAEGDVKDRLFTVYRTGADLRFLDLAIDPSDRVAGSYGGGAELLKANNYSPPGLVGATTLRGWLSMWSLEDSQCRGIEHFKHVTVPSLVIQAMADRGVFPSDAQQIYDALASKDKTLSFLPGGHFFEGGPGERAGVTKTIAEWASTRV